MASHLYGDTVLTSPFFVNAILPFVLVFTILFAILQKSKILGDGKRQIDAIVSLVIALIVISFANAIGVIVVLMPFLAVSAVIILVFLILYGMVFQGEDFKIGKNLRAGMGIVIGIAVVVAVMIATGAWDYIKYEWLLGNDSSYIITNAIFLIVVIAAIAILVWPVKKKD
jgi:hypothetical protein